jgi:hypothetical protein
MKRNEKQRKRRGESRERGGEGRKRGTWTCPVAIEVGWMRLVAAAKFRKMFCVLTFLLS